MRVAVADEDGNVVRSSSALVTIALGVNPTGSVITGLASVHAVNGVAEFRTAALSAAGIGYTLVAASEGLMGATSAPFDVVVPVPTTLSFQTQPAASVKDSVINPASIRVALLDENGDVFPQAYGVVQLAIGANPGGATLSGISAVATENGVATFTNLKLNAVGVGYTFVASLGAAPPVTSSPFNVTLSLADGDLDGYSPNEGDCDDANQNAHPGITDDFPDALFVDANCDGIDGNRSKAVFASPYGADNAACGTQAAPCRNLPIALQRAVALGKRDVYLFEGTYVGPVTLANGISIYGGYYDYCPNDVCVAPWQRHSNGSGSILSGELITNVDIGVGEPLTLTMYGANLSTPATIADVQIYAPLRVFDELTTATGRGRSSYAVLLRNIAPGVLTFERVGITASSGYRGPGGANGGNGLVTPATDGTVGGSGGAPVGCDAASRGTSGAGGTGAVVGASGGAGGRGGAKDTDCAPGSLDLSAQPGESGQNADAFQLGVFGTGGAFGLGSEVPCTVSPGNGLPGRVANGDRGPAIGGRGFLENDFWAGFTGSPGGLGMDGTGGGGGGGAGGCGDSYGAGGGGGGAGGARTHNAAEGGRAGGGSFGVYLINASPTIRNSYINRAGGGTGGVGGIGGSGQSGGQGGAGGPGGGGLPGGQGGNGAHGGHGAGGGGGAGGISVGIFRSSAASAPVMNLITFYGGNEHQSGGGGGGASAPTAPPAERDGIAGRAGPFGLVFEVFLCAAPTGC